MSESDTLRAVCDYLALRKHFFWRQNTTPVFNRESGSYRTMPAYAMRGVPDIILIKDGRFIGLEVKQPKSYLRPEQKEFQSRCAEHGARYHVVRSIDDVIALGL